MERKFTSEELLTRFEDRREIQNLAARYGTGFLLKQEAEMFATYWSKRDDICLGFNDGWYVGQEAVSSYYDALVAKNQLVAKLVAERFPKELEGKTQDELYGVGTIGYKPVDTNVIEIAGDRGTAKALFTVRGSHSELTDRGPVAYWNWGWMAMDLVWEDGQWKLWHLLEVDDISIPSGCKWAAGPVEPPYEKLPEFAEMAQFKLPEYSVKMVNREYYTADRPMTPSPEFPKPYETFAETFSYGI